MRQLLVLLAAALAVALGGFAVVTAQDATPQTNVAGTPCPEVDATPEATPEVPTTLQPVEQIGCATPTAATPAAGTPSAGGGAEEGGVAIADFAYDPETIEVPAGGTVTWTNEDGVPHTATAQDRDVLQSGTIAAGETYSQTFDEAGTIEYFCEFHPNMKGTVVVQ